MNSGACDEKPINSRSCHCENSTKASTLDVYKKNPTLLQQHNTQNDQKNSGIKIKTSKPSKMKKSGMWLTSDW